jgi:prevent-host-death family protein
MFMSAHLILEPLHWQKVASRSYFDSMRVVGLKVLKNKLSEYVRIAASGERVLVTDRDRVVAELVPPQYGTAEFASDATLAEAVRTGWIRPPLLPQQGPPARIGGLTFDEVMNLLTEDRADRA